MSEEEKMRNVVAVTRCRPCTPLKDVCARLSAILQSPLVIHRPRVLLALGAHDIAAARTHTRPAHVALGFSRKVVAEQKAQFGGRKEGEESASVARAAAPLTLLRSVGLSLGAFELDSNVFQISAEAPGVAFLGSEMKASSLSLLCIALARCRKQVELFLSNEYSSQRGSLLQLSWHLTASDCVELWNSGDAYLTPLRAQVRREGPRDQPDGLEISCAKPGLAVRGEACAAAG
ncbi:hypothetical protein Efla_002710 [Eimeria flavescens]